MNLWNSKKDQPDATGYVNAIEAALVQPDQGTAVAVNGVPIIITRYQNELYAISQFCPHAAGDLDIKSINRGRIDCPDHSYRFDIKTGRILWPEDEMCRLKRFAVKEESGMIKVKLD